MLNIKSLHVTARNFLCFLIMFLMFSYCFVQVHASETDEEETTLSAVLQDGGLLEEETDSGIMAFRMADQGEMERMLVAAVENLQGNIPMREYGMTVSELSTFLIKFLNNHPEYFYLNSSYNYSYDKSSNIVTELRLTYKATAPKVNEMVAAYNSKVEEIISGVNPSWSDLEKALYVNDYLALHCEYDNSHTYHSSYDALIGQKAVCQGYALAFFELMKQLGIPCELVTSDRLNHAWNLVQIGNYWYHVDVTWNDPVEDMCGRARHVYLLKSTKWFRAPSVSNAFPHNATDFVYSGPAGESQASSTAFDNCFWNVVDSAFSYHDGYWYGNYGSTLTKYTGSNGGLNKVDTIAALDKKWPVWGSASQTYSENFSGCCIFGGQLYYAEPNKILSLDLSSPSAEPVLAYELTDREQKMGYIYGFHITKDGILNYGISQSPNSSGVRRETDIHVHTFGAWIVASSGTCLIDGEEYQKCSVCGFQKTRTIPAKGHTPGSGVTCTQAQTCMVCGEVLSQAKGHTPGPEATCTSPQTCMICQEVLAKAKGHTPGTAATCTKDQKCTVCNTVIKRATGHRHTEMKTKAATFSNKGYVKIVCQDCGKTVSNKSINKVKCKKGAAYTVGNYRYKIMSAKTDGKGTVSFAGLEKNVKKVTIGDTVKIMGASFKIVKIEDRALKNRTSITSVTIGKNVHTIGKEAFYKTKSLRTIQIKSTKISKVGTNALKGIHEKAKLKVPKAKLKKYQGLFKNKGQKKTVKIS
ncbi:MAG: leucine-rich repeat protein [Lachnospiraceae bacterium]|nr:leucine-rich repeat protein [Lachnospiraceae bacterium]